MDDADFWIKNLGLSPHPEGGFFKEIFRSELQLPASTLLQKYSGKRNAVTSIYFLLKGNEVSHFHKLKSDEIWHFYTGSPITIHIINDVGDYRTIRLGTQINQDMHLQYAITPNQWFGATVDDPSSFTLVGCTVAPGFDFEDFELADQSILLQQFPQHEGIIKQLTR